MGDIMTEDKGNSYKARQTLMLHASKGKMDRGLAVQLFCESSKLVILDEEQPSHLEWKELARQIFKHQGVSAKAILIFVLKYVNNHISFASQINSTIDEWMTRYGVQPKSSLNIDQIDVQFFINVDTRLRGFAGVNVIYINADHFTQNKDTFKTLDESLFGVVMKVDIITLIIHAFSHLKLRQVETN